jgi:hypothetical protein
MRFIYVLIVSFLLCSSLWGQRTFASRAMDYHWMFKKFVWMDITDRYSGSLDTVVNTLNGKSYRTFIGDGLNFQIADSGSKVYLLKGSEEILLMDYSLNIGDTLKTSKYQMKILEKYKVKIENDSLWYMQMKSITNQPAVLWLESIGCLSLFHPINWYTYFGYADLGYNLDCVINNDTSILKQVRKNCALDNNLVNSNKIWHTWASNHNGDLKFSVPYYFTNRDTVLLGKNYWIMNQKNRYVRYDSIEGKYFILYHPSNGIEQLVYDDRVKVGDTMSTPFNQADTVVKIEYKWIEDDFRKVITTFRDVYISGIGSVRRVMWDNHLVTFPEYQAGNICFEENSVIRYHYPFFYQNKNQCEIISSIQNAINNSITIFPNPVLNVLNFNNSDKKEFKIRNSIGVVVLKGECEEKIDLAELPPGIYFLELMNNSRIDFFKFQK